MPEKNPDLFSFAVAGVAAFLGMLGRWWENKLFTLPFNFFGFLIDAVVSVAVGQVAFWVCYDYVHHLSVAVAVAILSGNLGTQAFSIAKALINRQVKPTSTKGE